MRGFINLIVLENLFLLRLATEQLNLLEKAFKVRAFNVFGFHLFGNLAAVSFHFKTKLVRYSFVWVQLGYTSGHLIFHNRSNRCHGKIILQCIAL